MNKLTGYIIGYIEAEISGAWPERFINLCSAGGVELWSIRRVSPICFRVKMRLDSEKRIEPYVNASMCELKIIRRSGLSVTLSRFKKRYALLAGIFLLLAVLFYIPHFIWSFEVSGNETIPSCEILRALDELGIGVGTYKQDVDTSMLKHQMILKLPKLSWITINFNGSIAQVLVRERSEKPTVIDESAPTNVIAGKTGIISKIEVLRGESKVSEGKTVIKGEVLVSGVSLKKSEALKTNEKDKAEIVYLPRYTHAMARVYARTWYNISAVSPVSTMKKEYTGRTVTKKAFIFAGKRINLYFSTGNLFEKYDKISTCNSISLPKGYVFPVSLVTDTYREYETVTQDTAELEESMKEYLRGQVSSQLTDGRVRAEYFTKDIKDGVMKVTIICECEEQIASVVPVFEEENNTDGGANN